MAGILVYQQIRELVRRGAIASDGPPIEDAQIQPASLDLRLGTKAWRVRAGFLAETTSVAERLEQTKLYEIDLRGGAILERGQCYLVPLLERIDEELPYRVRSNPKSSTGRLDLFTRLLADQDQPVRDVRSWLHGPAVARDRAAQLSGSGSHRAEFGPDPLRRRRPAADG